MLNANYLVSIKTLLEQGFDINKIYSHKNFKEQKECWEKCELKSDDLYNRSYSGIIKTLEIVLLLLNDNIDKIKTLENIDIIKK